MAVEGEGLKPSLYVLGLQLLPLAEVVVFEGLRPILKVLEAPLKEAPVPLFHAPML
ncbi:MAG: hypothetical protein QXF26_10150 [Candidatus Bathyarchaeia archaeon]